MYLPLALTLEEYFLAPSVWYGLLALPLLLLMYFLRLRRQEKILSSTLLWGEAIKDLRVNAPFQRIRASLLLILQVLILLMLAFALMRPFLSLDSFNAKLIVILIDNSASMRTADATYHGDAMTRLEQAKASALESVRRLNANDLVMVTEFNQRPRTMQSFTNVRASIERAIRDIQPTDMPTDFLEAMTEVQETIMTKLSTLRDSEDRKPSVRLYSDGAFDIQKPLELNPALYDDFQYVRCGQDITDNVGITALNVRRSLVAGIKDPLQAFFTVENFAYEPRTFRLKVMLDDQVVQDPRTITLSGRPIPGAPVVPDTQNTRAWRQDIMLALNPNSRGALKVELLAAEGQGGNDNLPADDVAVVDVPKPENTKVLVIMRENANLFLRRALQATQKLRMHKGGNDFVLDYHPPEWFQEHYGVGATEDEIVQIADYDVILFYDFAPAFRVGCSALYFGAIPHLPGYVAKGAVELPTIVDTNRSHYVTRYINLTAINAAKAIGYEYPRSAETLIRGNTGSLATADDNGRYRTIVVAMDLWDSNWLLHYTFPLFVHAALDFLTGASERAGGQAYHTGDALTFPPVNEETKIELLDADGKAHPLTLSINNPVYYADTRKAGMYKYQSKDDEWHYFGVNLANSAESDNAMRLEIPRKGGAPILGLEHGKENREIWPFLVMIGLVILMIEWLVYHRQWSN